jgi:hypothetical protein
MPCDTILKREQTLAERIQEVKKSLSRLERYLQVGQVRVQIGPQGAVVFVGWKDNDGVTDVCAYRTLSAQNSFALRRAVARAEALSGKKVNLQAVAAGYHSHDGGGSWSKH